MIRQIPLALVTIVALFGFGGCASDAQLAQLQDQTTRQSLIIKQQQEQIASLQESLEEKEKLLEAKEKRRPYNIARLYPKPKKKIKLKKVEDTNYNSSYMYPDNKKKTTPHVPTTLAPTAPMDKTQCIAIIGEAKYNRYTELFGSERAAIKRCVMIRAMQK